jgi:hypothetical protein
VNVAVVPYARKKGISVNPKNGEPLDAILPRLLQDALRIQVSQAGSRVQPNGTKFQSPLVERCKILQRELVVSRERVRDSEGQEQALRQRVQDLQADLLARVETTQVISDDDLAQDFRTLVSMVRTLSRMISFNESMDVVEILGSLGFLKGVSPQYWRGRAQKKRFIEAWTWAAICLNIFDTPFSIFRTEGKRLSESWTQIFGTKHRPGWPCPSTPCELWRYTTSGQLLQSGGRDRIVHGKDGSASDNSKLNVLDACRDAKDVIVAHLQLIDPNVDREQVSRIIDKAFKLAMQLSLQRPRLQVTHPEMGAKFALNSMVSMPDHDGEDIYDGIVVYVVNPGLTKWGDARGENHESRFDIVPSLVQLERASLIETGSKNSGVPGVNGGF